MDQATATSSYLTNATTAYGRLQQATTVEVPKEQVAVEPSQHSKDHQLSKQQGPPQPDTEQTVQGPQVPAQALSCLPTRPSPPPHRGHEGAGGATGSRLRQPLHLHHTAATRAPGVPRTEGYNRLRQTITSYLQPSHMLTRNLRPHPPCYRPALVSASCPRYGRCFTPIAPRLRGCREDHGPGHRHLLPISTCQQSSSKARCRPPRSPARLSSASLSSVKLFSAASPQPASPLHSKPRPTFATPAPTRNPLSPDPVPPPKKPRHAPLAAAPR